MLQAMGATATLVNSWYSTPPCMGSDAEFTAARRVFEEAGYNYGNLCQRLGVHRLYEYQMAPAAEILARPVNDALDVMHRLFSDGLHLDRSIVEQMLTPEGRAALCALHLLAPSPADPEKDFAPAAVIPFLDSLTATDRFSSPSGEPVEVPADGVYPALFDTTYNLVTRLPERPCDALLDLGTGTGAAAICHARFAQRVWATDITPRSVYFAEFNRRLNGCGNVTTVAGDLYEPVRGLTFDRIVSQPPYVAVETDKIAFRDGGKDGEQIFRRIVEGLPEYLRPGGACYALLMASDREGETFEQRIRKWLGAREVEFDVLVGCDMAQDPAEFLRTARKIPAEEKEYRRVLYQRNGTRAVLYCSVVIRRFTAPRQTLNIRTFLGKSARGKDLDFLLDWNAAVALPEGPEMVWNARPRLGVHCELMVVHRVREGRLVAEDFELHTKGPFSSKGKTPAWVAQLVAECDGSVTWGERFEGLQSAGRIPPSVTREEFSHVLSVLISTGVLEVAESFSRG